MSSNVKTAVVLSALILVLAGSTIMISGIDGEEPSNGNVASVNGQGYGTLQEALDAAQDGDVVTILDDIKLEANDQNAGALIGSGVTIEGNGHTVTTDTATYLLRTVEDSSFGTALTIRNLNLVNDSGAKSAMCLITRNMTSNLVLENVSMIADSGANTQPLTIGGATDVKIDVTITGCSFISSDSGYAIICFNPVDMTITDTYLEGWAVIFMKAASAGGGGTQGSVIEVSDSEIVSINNHTGPRNDFCAIVFQDTNTSITLTDVNVTVGETAGNRQSLFGSDPYTHDTGLNFYSIGGDNTTVTFVGENVTMLYVYQDDEYIVDGDCEITGGTFVNVDTSEITQHLADGLEVSIGADGKMSVSEPKTNPPIIWDDDDDYVPIPPVVVDDSSDDDTVTIVACAAAAVVAALMAVFLIIERRK